MRKQWSVDINIFSEFQYKNIDDMKKVAAPAVIGSHTECCYKIMSCFEIDKLYVVTLMQDILSLHLSFLKTDYTFACDTVWL